jgi:dolichyl-phosphate beta-glucosyltransferase
LFRQLTRLVADGAVLARVKLFLVIPAYCEAARLPRCLAELTAALAAAPFDTDLTVVDDGSPLVERRAMAAAVEAVRARHEWVRPLHSLPRNGGKGAAVRAGWDAALAGIEAAGAGKAASRDGASWLGFVDADGAVPAGEVVRLCRVAIDGGAAEPVDAVWASRVRMLGRNVERSVWRHWAGRVFATMTALAVERGVYDSQCGAKLVRAAAYRRVRPWLAEGGFAFDVELLAALRQIDTRMVEVPVDWSDVPGGKVSVLRDSLRMVRALLRIRRRRRRWTTPSAAS